MWIDNCRRDLRDGQAFEGVTHTASDAHVVQVVLHRGKLQSRLENKHRDGLRYTELRERHAKKLKLPFGVVKPEER